ncbi:MAG: hypothetical protein JWQ01_329 [Massilia sp.]|jgi:hypothetical protein|nr:hypothetical protein [Massilia sp.]
MKCAPPAQALLLALTLASPQARADDYFTRIEPVPASEFWLTSGFETFHFDREKGLSGRNNGLGAEYRLRGDIALTIGHFRNSDREPSTYVGAIWQPYALGPVRLGVVGAAFNGYPRMRQGGWFPALIPVATVEYKYVGVNLGFVPSYKDRLYGGLSVQLKFKLSL